MESTYENFDLERHVQFNFVAKKGLDRRITEVYELTERLAICVVTCNIHHRQRRHSPLHKHAQCFNNGSIWVNESDVAVCANAQLLQSLPHEGWFRHLTHLQDHKPSVYTGHYITQDD